MRVYLFVTCLVDTFFPGVGEGMVKVLDRLGVDVEFPKGQTCCGQPAFNSGYREDAQAVAERFVKIFGEALEASGDEESYIVCPSGSCTAMVKVFYKELFANNPVLLDKLNTITGKTYEFSEFLIKVMKRADVGARYDGVVTYHDSCHLLRELGVKDEPRRLIGAVNGIEFREMDMHDACCGFGGTFSIKFPRVSVSMLDEKIDCIIGSGADTVVSSDMGCLMNIKGALTRRKIPVKVMHIAELLAHTQGEGGSRVSETGYGNVNFEADSGKAVDDKKLQSALVNVTNRFRQARQKASSEVPGWDELRTLGREIKKETIENLDRYLLMLEESVKKAGGHVHWAADGEEASQIIVEIARKNGVKSVVKSKSMATEEVELNRNLEMAGIRAVETDLGEYIIQLAGEHPSHIIAPAVHKTKDDISKLFHEKLGTPHPSEPEELTKVAREKMRSEFLNAGMGVSGANFAVAETGTIVIVENEGNARLTTTVPDIHVALVGIEKIIPRYADLSLFLTLLARSATGQKSSTYVSFITGPRRETDRDGPREFHLVLLDNGRSRILANKETRESLYCIRCGACLNNCPVYRKVGGHSYGWVYSGPIGAIINPQLLGIDKAPELPFASSLCGACRDVCPVRIDFPKVLLELRHEVRESGAGKGKGAEPFIERLSFRLWRTIVTHEKLYAALLSLAYYLQTPFRDKDLLRSLPYPFSRWTRDRDFPAVAETTFRERWKKLKNGGGQGSRP